MNTRSHQSRGSRARRRLSRGLGLLLTVGNVALLLTAAAWIYLVQTGGARALVVETGSMAPEIPAGSLIVVKPAAPQDVRVGDVITFRPAGHAQPVTHRVQDRVRKGGTWYFRTKGDANPTADRWRPDVAVQAGLVGPPSPEQQILAQGVSYGRKDALRVEASFPRLGHLAVPLAAGPARFVLLGAALLLVLVRLLSWIWRDTKSGVPATAGTEGERSLEAREAA